MKKIFLLSIILLFGLEVQSQITPVTKSNGILSLPGKGLFNQNKDGGQWYRYKTPKTGNFQLSAYFDALSTSNRSFTGLAFRFEPSKTDGGIPCVGIFYENDTLKVKYKALQNQKFVDVAFLSNVKIPGRLKIEKNLNKFKAYYSPSPKNSTNPTYILVAEIANVFNNWTTITQNFVTGSKTGNTAIAQVSYINYGDVTPENGVPCTNGGTFNILAITQKNGSLYDVSFNASNLYSVNIDIKNSSGVSVRSYSKSVTSNPLSIDIGNQPAGTSLPTGTYTLKLTGESCVGTASKTFAITDAIISAPVISCNPTQPIQGSLATFTATGCTQTVNWYKNSANNGIVANTPSLSVPSPVAGDSYFAKCSVDGVFSLASNLIEVFQVAGTGGTNTGQNSFANVTKSAPFETVLSKYSPDAFPTISVVNSLDPVLNKNFPNWSISWKVEGTNFVNSSRNKRTPNVGIPFMFDLQPSPYGGYGVRCVDYVFVQNPNTGVVWQADEACAGSQFNQYFNNQAHTIANFSSALPFHERAGDGGGAGLDKIAEWNGISDLGYFYDQGQIGGERFGFRDFVNGKANVGLADYDNEATFDSNKSLAILLGLASKSQGYVFDQYANIMQGVYIDPSQYPNDFNNPNSSYPQYTQLLDGTNGAPNSGSPELITNGVPARAFWNPNYKISIPSKFSGTKGVVDEPTILPSTEVSCISSAAFRQGESYVFNTTRGTRVVNKFGLNANTQHMIARTIFSGETSKWYCVNRLNNRKMILQAKILCDQQQNGLLLDENYTNTYITNQALANKHFDREFSFDIGAFVAMTGCEWNIWDRNQMGVNLDGYNGAFGIINLLNQRKTFGNTSVSFVDLKPRAKFLLWESQISYDNGANFVKDKANHYVMSQSKIPQRQFITPDGYWGGFLARPENTEATSCILRVSYNGQNYTHTVTPDMWETVDYNFRNTALASLPNDKKDYYYFLIKLGGVVSEEGSANAPAINSNPSPPIAGSSATFTANGCNGTVKWFIGDGQVGTGSALTVTNPVAGNTYFATCTVGNVSSNASNPITVIVPPNPNSGNTVNVFIMAGESNAGTRNPSSTLLSGEGGVRAGVRIWNNNTNVLEPLNIGVNNALDENDVIAPGWGWENQLANLRRDGVLNSDFVVIKTGQGGAFIQSFHPNRTPHPNYYDKTIARINGVKTALALEGKTPIFYIMYSQGINDALVNGGLGNGVDEVNFPGLSGPAYWKQATLAHLQRLRDVTGQNTKICLMKFWDFPQITLGGYTNAKINEIVASNPNNLSIDCSDLTGQLYPDQVHPNQIGTKTVTNRYITAFGLANTPTPLPSGGVTITEPNKPQFFFSNGQAPNHYLNRSNLPAVINNTSTFDAVNDIVYLENSQVKYGINLKRGGQLAYASVAGSNDNLIYNGFDGGFQVQLDATQILEPATIAGQTSGSPQNNTAYNTTMGGDYLNHSQTLIDYHPVGNNGYYVKFRPILYPFDAVISDVEIEATYTLIGRALKIEYNYTSFRGDGNFPLNPQAPQGFKGWAIPVSFLVEKLNKYQTYTGNSPYNHGSPTTGIEDGSIPNTTPGQGGATILGRNTKEFWGLSYNQSSNTGFGVMNLSEGGTERSFRWEQRQKYAGNGEGTVFTGGYTVMDMFTNVLVPNGGNFTKNIVSFVAVGQPSEIISTFYNQAGH